MKQIQGSVRVKIKEYAHAWFEFLFVSLLVIFNFFPQINHFYYFTSRHGLQDVENHCAHLRDIELKTAMRMRKRYLFCTSGHLNVPYEKQQEVSPKMRVLERARAQLLNMLYIGTNLSVPHGENI